MQNNTFKSLKTLVVLLSFCIVGGCGACTMGVVGLSLLKPDPIKLSNELTIDELMKRCGKNTELSGVNYATWVRPSLCMDVQRLEVSYNLRTRKLMDWRITYGKNRSTMMKKEFKANKGETIEDVKKRCGQVAEESPGRVLFKDPDCEAIAALEVRYLVENGQVNGVVKSVFKDGLKL